MEPKVVLDEDVGLEVHVLIVPAKEANNNITVQCTIYTINDYLGSSIAKLRIQGRSIVFLCT